MDMYKVKWTALQSEIFRLLCIKAGENLTLRGIARYLKKSPTAISNSLANLEKEKLVNINKFENINLLGIELNRDNEYAIKMKRFENLKLIYESNLEGFLHETFPGATIILFGSFSRGDDVLGSDIDIAIIGAKEKKINLTKFDKKLERIIFINFYKSFKDIHKNLRDNILNGIVLSGSVDL